MRLALLILVFILQALQPVTAQQSSNVLVSSATNQAPAYGENAIIFFGTETMSLAEALARDTDLFNHPKNTTNDVIIFAYGAGRLTKRSERLDFFIYDTDKYLTALERVSLDLLSALEVVMSGDENQKSLSVMETSERAYRTAGHGEKLLKLTGEFNIYSNKPKIYFHARNVEIVEWIERKLHRMRNDCRHCGCIGSTGFFGSQLNVVWQNCATNVMKLGLAAADRLTESLRAEEVRLIVYLNSQFVHRHPAKS